jgi:DUF971 family protein
MGVPSAEPERVERLGQSGLKVRWRDGHESLYSWEQLRTACPCAACRNTGGLPQAVVGVKPIQIEPVGRYAMTVRWNDGHTTGIFSHPYLRSLCRCQACLPDQEA